jgi:head-tail adaptor
METSFSTIYEDIRAEIVPLSGREYIAARQVVADVTTRINIRRLPLVTANCRILRTIEDDSPPTVEVYDVLAVLPDPVSGLRYMNLMCVQRIAEGFRRGE